MSFTFGTGANLRDTRNHGVDDSTTGVFRLPGDLVLGTFPAIGFTGANFSVYSLSGERIIAAQELDPSRFVTGSRIVEEQYIFGALRDGDTLTVFFSEQGYNDTIRDFEFATYMRQYSLTTGQALGASVEIDVPAMLTPDNSFAIQTSTGQLAVSAGYGGLGALATPRDLGLILINPDGTVARGPDQLPPDTWTSPNGGGQAVVETSEGFMTFHAETRLVGSGWNFSYALTASYQRHDANGALIGGPVTLFEIPDAGTARPQDVLKAVELTDGRIVVVVADRNPPALPAGEVALRLRATILNPDGSVSVPDFALRRAPDQTSGFTLPFFSLNALDDGGFVVGYNINGSSANQTMGFQVYGANAQPEEFHTYTHTIAAVIAGLPNQQDYTTLRGDGTGLVLDGTLTGVGIAVPVSDAPPDGPVIEVGTVAPELMEGADLNDSLEGVGGNDTLRGFDGNDTLRGGTENDLIEGGNGDDSLAGDAGADTILGGAGNDAIDGGASSDHLSGEAGDDTIHGGSSADTIYGGDGNDSITGGTSADLIHAENGNDTIFGGTSDDTIYGGQMSDLIWGEDGNDSLLGDSSADTIHGGDGDDFIDGGSSADTLHGGDGNDSILGGTSADLIHGDNGADTIRGGTSDDTIQGGQMSDLIHGDDGNDSLMGDSSTDTIHGGQGNDYLDGGSSADTLHGDAGADTIWGGSSADLIHGGTENDSLRGGTSNDTIFGGSHNDRIWGDSGNDSLMGDGSADTIYGGDGNDLVDGGTSSDRLFGGSGTDTLIGGSGNDTLYGGASSDTLTGGIGRDVFVFSTGIGVSVDTITDFTPEDDTIRLEDHVFAGLNLGALGEAAFVANATGEATTAEQRLIYNATTGDLSFDADGSGAGAAVRFAVLGTGLALTHEDFLVI